MELDDTAKLIAEAQAKLAELDGRVAAYRLQMATEFNRFLGDLLQNVPEHAAYKVSQAVADSLVDYPHLFPAESHHRQSQPGSETLTKVKDFPSRNKGSPPPVLPHTSGTPKESIRSPHDRELEFQGLFTPTYLPLLDCADRPIHSPPASPDTGSTPNIDERLAVRNPQTSEGTQTSDPPQISQETLIPPPTSTSEVAQTAENTHHQHRPSPLRRTTGTSVDSLVSDSSSVKIRKSALRRSSGSSREADSPRESRRVRFQVEGQEVFPSSSFQASTTALAEGLRADSETSADIAYDSLPLTSLSDIEADDDPPPRKVSSSQALRALSKAPLDDPTTWTVVNAGSEDSASDADRSSTRIATSPSLRADDRGNMAPKSFPLRPSARGDRSYGDSESDEDSGYEKAKAVEDNVEAEDESSEDDDPLMIISKKDFKKRLRATESQTPKAPDLYPASAKRASPDPKVIDPKASQAHATPPISPELISSEGSATKVASTDRADAAVNSGPAHASDDEQDEEDELFALEADEDDETLMKAISAHASPKKHIPEPVEEELENDEVADGKSCNEADEYEAMFKPNAPIKASPPIGMPMKKTTDIPPKVPPKPQGSIPKMSVGSYGGKPITMHPVKDPGLLEEINSSENDHPFFVGSVNGRSGPDPSNAKSYRASLPSPAGSGPGTFMERWIREKEGGIKYASDKEDDDNEDDENENDENEKKG